MLLQRAHRQQRARLRSCQEKVAKTKGLEETVRQQEKVTWGGRKGCDGHHSLALSCPHALVTQGWLCPLPQVIEAMERVLQEKLSRSTANSGGGWPGGTGTPRGASPSEGGSEEALRLPATHP